VRSIDPRTQIHTDSVPLPERQPDVECIANEYVDQYFGALEQHGAVRALGASEAHVRRALASMRRKRTGTRRLTEWDRIAVHFIGTEVETTQMNRSDHETTGRSRDELPRTAAARNRTSSSSNYGGRWSDELHRKTAANLAKSNT